MVRTNTPNVPSLKQRVSRQYNKAHKLETKMKNLDEKAVHLRAEETRTQRKVDKIGSRWVHESLKYKRLLLKLKKSQLIKDEHIVIKANQKLARAGKLPIGAPVKLAGRYESDWREHLPGKQYTRLMEIMDKIESETPVIWELEEDIQHMAGYDTFKK